MPVILAILSALTVAGIWYYRMQAAKDAADVLLDAANDVRLAARRFGFSLKNKTHPADCVDDPRLAAAGIVVAIASMDSDLSQDEIDRLLVQCQSKFGVSREEAEEIVLLGRWLVGSCVNKDEAVRRLTRRVIEKAGGEAAADLLEMIDKVAGPEGLSIERAADAVATIKRLFAIR
jgi:uncharacterized tellurite resistance protein B-like protein